MEGMRIIRLEAEGVKRLQAVDITPDGALVEISGRNRQGKTSILDAIWWALAGKRAIQSEPIRHGEESAVIRLDLGAIRVTRRFTRQDEGGFSTSLKVENAEGASFSKPQDILDAMVGELTFDPLAFTRMKADEQVAALQALVPDFDFTESAQADDRDYRARTEANRQAKDLATQASHVTLSGPVPAERVDEEPILVRLRMVDEANGDRRSEEVRREREAHALLRDQGAAQAAFERAAALRQEARDVEAHAVKMTAEAAEREARLKALPPLPEPVSVAQLTQELEAARAGNRALERHQEKVRLEAEAKAARERSEALTAAMEAREKERAAAVAAAQLPIEGLTLGAGGVALNGAPFSQASDAEQLRASIAIAGAMNPRLRIIRVRDGSLLDTDAMEMLRAYAEEHDLQVWCEVVQSPRASAIVIEDGRVLQEAPLAVAAE